MFDFLRKIASFFYRIWAYFQMALWLIILGPIVYISTFFNNFSFTNAIIWLWSWLVFYLSGMQFTLFSDEKISQKQYIIIANHTSIFDIMLMYLLHRNLHLTFVGKKELVKIPIFGAVYKRVCILVDRESRRSRTRVYDLAAEKLKNGKSLVIFPEGGVPDEKVVLDNFKDGAFSIAIQTQIPILVYTFVGLKEAFPFDFFKGKPKRINVYFEKIIPTKNLTTSDRNTIKSESFQLIYNRLVANRNKA